MQKLSLAIGAIFLIVAIFYFFTNTNTSKQSLDSAQQQESLPVIHNESNKQDSSFVGSVKNAMGLGKKMVCLYPSTDGTATSSTIFIDGQKIKFTTTINGETMHGLFDGTVQYIWSTGEKKQGMKMDTTCLEELKSIAPKQALSDSIPQAQNYQDFENIQNMNCTETNTEDFSIPSDIVFIDQCEMMRNIMPNMQQFKGSIPQGIDIPVNY